MRRAVEDLDRWRRLRRECWGSPGGGGGRGPAEVKEVHDNGGRRARALARARRADAAAASAGDRLIFDEAAEDGQETQVSQADLDLELHALELEPDTHQRTSQSWSAVAQKEHVLNE